MFKWVKTKEWEGLYHYSLDVGKIYIVHVLQYVYPATETWVARLTVAKWGIANEESYYCRSAEEGMTWAEGKIISYLEEMRDLLVDRRRSIDESLSDKNIEVMNK